MKKDKSNFFRLFLSIFRLKDYLISFIPKARRKLLAFFVFFALSTILWLFRSLDESFIASVEYPVKFINLPKNKMLTTAPLSHITLNVRGKGYTILNNKISSPILVLDVNNFSFFTQSDGLLSVYLTSSLAKEILSQELNRGNQRLDIINISPDTLYFSFAKTQSKVVPIKANFTNPGNLLAQQYMLNGPIKIMPDSTIIIGPSTIIDTLRYISTKPLKLSKLNDSTTKKIGLNKIAGTQNNLTKVEVRIPVDRYTETKFEVPLMFNNVPDSISLVTFPRTVTVTFLVTLSNLNKLTKKEFQPFIDYSDIAKEPIKSNIKLKVYFGTLPYYAKMMSVYPEKVDYLIEYNHAESRNNRGDR